ncbi:MAG: hypothetical protein A3F68_01060 [Acidobacteria bacterium RIFCSPLOWO2_12_FULL_54_10]|nr:MAG: hypothetical protein A3F68_01060 [Acidobacteria bacterium RIFCSPLOWO2_12_FULL_54_10]
MAGSSSEIHSISGTPGTSGFSGSDKPEWEDYSRCIRCGLCLNQCPTYRELGVEMDSPRGRIYQMVQVAEGRLPLGDSFVRHMDLCLGCRACETACPSGVEYGKLIEGARAQIEQHIPRPLLVRWLRHFAFHYLIPRANMLKVAGFLLWAYQASGLQAMMRRSGFLNEFPRLAELDALSPQAEAPFFFSNIGKVFPAQGKHRYRVAFHAGCIANVSFARLQEATVRVLQENGCEVIIPAGQTCCGALHVHAGIRDFARELARKNIEIFLREEVDAIITNAAGCGSALKEYGYLLKQDAIWAGQAEQFASKTKDILEFLAEIGLTQKMHSLPINVTYQDSCHLVHGQKVRNQPRTLLESIPGIRFSEMPLADVCCGSAGIYNLTETELSMKLLRSKMESANSTNADIIATANPGCMLQLRAGASHFGKSQRVVHVVELLDEARESA